MWRRFRWKCDRMISCGVLLGVLLEMSEINSVPSMGYPGVSSLDLGLERPLLLASFMTSWPPFVVYSGVWSSLMLWVRLVVLPLGAWSSIAKRRSACCCALCAFRTSLNPAIKFATSLAWARPASLWGGLLSWCFQFGRYYSLCRCLYCRHWWVRICAWTAGIMDRTLIVHVYLSPIVHVYLSLIRQCYVSIVRLTQICYCWGNPSV